MESKPFVNGSEPRRKTYAITWQSVAAVANYATHRYHHLDQFLVAWKEKRLVRRLLRKIRAESHTLLDIPTGYGRFTPLFLENGFDLLSCDLNLYALLYQRQQYPQLGRAVVASVFALPFRDRHFDVVFNFRLIQHFKTSAERQALLQEIQRVTRRFAIVSVYLPSIFHRLSQILGGRPRRMTMVTPADWEAEVQANGLRVVQACWVWHFLHAQKIFLLELAGGK